MLSSSNQNNHPMHHMVAISSGSSSACRTPASCYTSMNNLNLLNFWTKATQHNQGLPLFVLGRGKGAKEASLFISVLFQPDPCQNHLTHPDEVAISFAVYSFLYLHGEILHILCVKFGKNPEALNFLLLV